MSENQNYIDESQISIKDVFLKFRIWIVFLKTNFKIIIISGILGGFIGLTIAFLDKPIYKAVLTFAIEEDKGGGGLSGALGLASSFGIEVGGAGGGVFASSNLGELMKSRTIVEKVILSPVSINNKTTTLAEYYINSTKLRNKWIGNNKLYNLHYFPNTIRSNLTFYQDSILKILHKNLIDKNHLTISQKDKKISILSIEYNNEDELFAKMFCESIAKETSKYYIETKSKKARNNVDVLQKQVDSVRRELDKSINGFAIAADNVYNLNPALNIKNTKSKKSQIDVQSNTTILTNLVVQLELAKISLRKETPLLQVIDQPIFPLEKERYSKLKTSLSFSALFIFLSILFLVIKKSIL